MGLIYSEKFHVRGREVDRYGNMTLATLARLLLVVSGQQTDDLNAQYGNPLEGKNLTWFILQHDMIITRMPQWNDTITIETEAVAYNRFFTHRHFRVWCQDTLIVETVMRFAIVDMKERKLVRISPELVQNYQVTEMTKLDAMTKIDKVDGSPSKTQQYNTYFSQIDMNQHVNNAVYLDWVIDSLDATFLKQHTPKQVTIIYENEVRLGDTVTHELHQYDNTSIHYLSFADKSFAKAQIKWEKHSSVRG